MKILSSNEVYTEKQISVRVTNKNKEFVLIVTMHDGKVIGNENNGVATSYGAYFNENIGKRKRDFETIKKHAESIYRPAQKVMFQRKSKISCTCGRIPGIDTSGSIQQAPIKRSDEKRIEQPEQ